MPLTSNYFIISVMANTYSIPTPPPPPPLKHYRTTLIEDFIPKQNYILPYVCAIFIRHSYNDIIVLIMTFHYGYYY